MKATTFRRPRIERDRPRLTGRAAVLLVALTILGFMAAVPARQYLVERGRIAELERTAAGYEELNGDLRAQISRLRDPAELERLARACLGMVAPGEVLFVTPGSADAANC
ncbi:MAG: septum formation initiator family protein [Actinobacteria bacterium]|nr:septum formation initiator family protein [Actinomycetota bacterium]